MRSVLFYLPTDWLGLPPAPVFGFGAMVVLAFVAGVFVARRRAVRLGLDGEKTVDLCLYAVVAGIVGARLTYLLFDYVPDPTGEHFLLDMIAIWKGGLTYQGGLIAGIFVVWYYMHTRYWPTGRYLDALAPAVLVGAGIGRIGCFLNGCCWGRLARAGNAWAVKFPEKSEVVRAQLERMTDDPATWTERLLNLGYSMPVPEPPLAVLPTQLMETAGYLFIALLLVGVERVWRKRADGSLMLLGVVFYSIFRFIIEFFRDDTPPITLWAGGPEWRFGQWVAVFSVVAAVAIWIYIARRGRNKAPDAEC